MPENATAASIQPIVFRRWEMPEILQIDAEQVWCQVYLFAYRLNEFTIDELATYSELAPSVISEIVLGSPNLFVHVCSRDHSGTDTLWKLTPQGVSEVERNLRSGVPFLNVRQRSVMEPISAAETIIADLEKESLGEDKRSSLRQAEIFLDAAQEQLVSLNDTERRQRIERIKAARRTLHGFQTNGIREKARDADARALRALLEVACAEHRSNP